MDVWLLGAFWFLLALAADFLSIFTWKSAVFIAVSSIVLSILPRLTRATFSKWGGRYSEQETKFFLFFLFILGYLAYGNELPDLPLRDD